MTSEQMEELSKAKKDLEEVAKEDREEENQMEEACEAEKENAGSGEYVDVLV